MNSKNKLNSARNRRQYAVTTLKRVLLHRNISPDFSDRDFLRLPSVTVRQATNSVRGHTVAAARLVLSALAPQSAMDAVAAAEIAAGGGGVRQR